MTRRRSAAVEVSKDAPWQRTPFWIARRAIQENEDWQLDSIFPEVYEEDRTSKLKDLATAQAVGAITHQRMAEQMAKELGFDDYDYDAEIEAIVKEQQTLPTGILGISDAIGSSTLGPASTMKGKGTGGGGTINIGQPGPGVTSEEPGYEPRYDFSRAGAEDPRRADLSGERTARFRRLQRAPHGER